mmetsp:Transcript_28881/g.67232  ORF Transcript_28881/g.67232 Transcript_28881/m.67232 type:complete len:206 (+) Transcript_28881:1033-1650(+)
MPDKVSLQNWLPSFTRTVAGSSSCPTQSTTPRSTPGRGSFPKRPASFALWRGGFIRDSCRDCVSGSSDSLTRGWLRSQSCAGRRHNLGQMQGDLELQGRTMWLELLQQLHLHLLVPWAKLLIGVAQQLPVAQEDSLFNLCLNPKTSPQATATAPNLIERCRDAKGKPRQKKAWGHPEISAFQTYPSLRTTCTPIAICILVSMSTC